MCVGPAYGPTVSVPSVQPKAPTPARTLETPRDVWARLAEEGGVIGTVARQKLDNTDGPSLPTINVPKR